MVYAGPHRLQALVKRLELVFDLQAVLVEPRLQQCVVGLDGSLENRVVSHNLCSDVGVVLHDLALELLGLRARLQVKGVEGEEARLDRRRVVEQVLEEPLDLGEPRHVDLRLGLEVPVAIGQLLHVQRRLGRRMRRDRTWFYFPRR